MNHDTRRNTRLLVAGGVLASMMPLTTGAVSPAAGATVVAEYGGFTAGAWSSPVRIEVFEPSIPIPVDAGIAQVEFDMGYSSVQADSSSSSGRSSLFWPGDPVGEGLKTFAEQLGLPSTPLTANGYPVQVNSQYPGDQTTQTDNKIPGSIQQTTSGDKTAIAETGFSPDGAVLGPDDGAETSGGAANPLSQLTEQLQKLLGGGSTGVSRTSAPANPLALLVDVDGYVSVSRMDASKGPVVTASRAVLGEIRLLGGLVTMGGLETSARATTDGAKGTATGTAKFGTMSVAGQAFSIGPDGIEAAGSTSPIPGLDDLPADALKQLGISIEVPKQVRTVEGDLATSLSQALRITIDTKVLAPVLRAIPAGVLAELIPAQAGPLKGVVAGLSSLAPKVVITLGVASATVDTVPPIVIAPASPIAPPAAAGAPAAPVAGAVGVPPAAVGAPAPVNAAPGAGGAPVADLVDAAPASAGLPDLFSIPGMFLLAAFVVAAVAGSWFRRLGAAALGAGAPCPHGLESGLPDLRKA
ncbi:MULTISPECIES: hypothetical protein [unclassified Nocardioides]|uniref:hypothetical protein n=1 Tax=unclassified Nocardioides TaxID=2615069 RepID=UPI0006FE3513|nr:MULTISPECIES: hypothetical protein [unclassified Nocardioides]KRA38060.1 hypothetical protein ASD81_05165 [Nocardioides sp. Root614]KRA92020.1 hypothetical protein ASD84_05430 [Nocardioides sp. Root682]